MLIEDIDRNVLTTPRHFLIAPAMDARWIEQDAQFRALVEQYTSFLPRGDESRRLEDCRDELLRCCGLESAGAEDCDLDALLDELEENCFSSLHGAETAYELRKSAERFLGAGASRKMLARLTLACWMFRREPERLVPAQQLEQLRAGGECGSVDELPLTDGQELKLLWPCPPEEGRLRAVKLVNRSSEEIRVYLRHADGRHLLKLSPGCRCSALMAENALCCIKSGRAQSAEHSFERRPDGIYRDGQPYTAEDMDSFAADGEGGIHRLRGGKVRFTKAVDPESELSIACAESGVLELFGRDRVVVAVDAQGRSISNMAPLSGLDVSAVVELPGIEYGVFVLTRQGGVHQFANVQLDAAELLKRFLEQL